MKLNNHNPLRQLAMMTVMTILLFFTLEEVTGRTSQLRYLNSMPQFGKAQVKADAPTTTVFSNVPQGYLTSYSTLVAQTWTFTSLFSSNATAVSDPTAVDSDSFGTIFTCQTNHRKMKNFLVYDNSRSNSPRKASIRVVNLAQYDYAIDLSSSDGTISFNSVNYCDDSSYINVPPGDYDLSWTVSNDKKRNTLQRNNKTVTTLYGGYAYTTYVTPSVTTTVVDGRTTAKRNVNTLRYAKAPAAEETPQSDSGERVEEEVDVSDVKAKNLKKKQSRRSKIAGNSAKEEIKP